MNRNAQRGPRIARSYINRIGRENASLRIGGRFPLAFKEAVKLGALETHGAADPNKGKFLFVAQTLDGCGRAIQKARNLALPQ
jgi:hypothetical protein